MNSHSEEGVMLDEVFDALREVREIAGFGKIRRESAGETWRRLRALRVELDRACEFAVIRIKSAEEELRILEVVEQDELMAREAEKWLGST